MAANRPVLPDMLIPGQMGQTEQDFEKGEADGTADTMRMLEAIVQQCGPPSAHGSGPAKNP